MNLLSITYTILVAISFTTPVFAQNTGLVNPTPKLPQPSYNIPNSPSQVLRPKTHNKDPLEAHRQQLSRDAARKRQMQQLKMEMAAESEKAKSFRPSVQYNLPSRMSMRGAGSFKTAFAKLKQMANDSNLFTINEAVFTVENAFYFNTGEFERVDKAISDIASFLEGLMPKYGYDLNDNLAKNLMIFRFFTDTLISDDSSFHHTPIQYDFEDYRGKLDYAKQMVSKVMVENSWQCHSLPLLYIMIAEKMQAESYLALAPYHSYIKIPLPQGGYQNIELTSRILTSDAHVLQSGFVTAEALQNELYLRPLSEIELLSYCITDLAKEYVWKYGHDPFVQEMIEYALELFPNNIVAHKVLSNQYTVRFMHIERQLGVTEQNFQTKMKQYPKALAILQKRNEIYDNIDALGYRFMTGEQYESWLNGIMEEGKEQQEKSNEYKGLENTIKH